MKKFFKQGWATKTFSKKTTVYITVLLSSIFISGLLSSSAFAATSSTAVTVKSTDNQTYAKSLGAWASEKVLLAGLAEGVGGDCNNTHNSRTWGKQECINKYVEGYNDRKDNKINRNESCSKFSGNNEDACKLAYDGGAYLARIEARGATPDLSSTELQARVDEYCLSKSEDKNARGDSPKEVCEKGFKAGYKGQSKENACKDLGNLEDDCKTAYDAGDGLARGVEPTVGASSTASSEDIPCVGGPMGWVLCPIINYMADIIVSVAGFIDSMMQFKLLIGTESGNQIRDAVGSFTAVANIILVIGFLIIIFSQTTSLGLSNYGIKKMLPKVVITAILINLSFYLCAFAIDISNIAGNAIMGFITGQSATNAAVSKGITDATQLSGPGSVNTVFSTVLGGAVGVILLIMFLGPLALGVFITFVILVARQVILLFLVLVAPLAFAAWLLPNTESWFKKWKDLFVNMLVAYPMLMAVFGVALFAAKFISQIAQTSTVGQSGVVAGNTIAPLISLLVLAIPLLALPFILKSSNAMLGKVSGFADKFGRQSGGKANAGLKKMPGTRSAYEMMEQRKSTREAAFGRAKAGRSAKRAGGLRGKVIYGGLPGETTRLAKAGMEGQAASAEEGLEKQEIDNRRAVMKNHPKYASKQLDLARDELVRAHHAGDRVGVRAALAELSQSNVGTDIAHRTLRSFETGEYKYKDDNGIWQKSKEEVSMNSDQKDAIATGVNDNWSAFKSKDVAITGWSTDKNGLADVEKKGGTYSGLTAEQISTQTPTAIDRGVRSGGITVEMARSILGSDAQKNLSSESRSTLEKLVGPTAPPPSGGSSGSGSGTGSSSSSGGSSGGGWSRGGNNAGGTSGGTTWTPGK